MILAIDMGNTNTVIGGIDEERTYFIERVTTDQGRTDTEYAVSFKNILEMNQIDVSSIEGAILSSVVPPLNSTTKALVEKITDAAREAGFDALHLCTPTDLAR